MRHLVVIPCFNEEASLGATLSELRRHLPTTPVLVVDDGSRDGTAQVAQAFASQDVTLLRHPQNLGYGSAVQTGAKYAVRHGFDAVALFDADGQHDAADLPAAMFHVERGDADVVVGSRFLGSCGYRMPALRMFGIRLFRGLLRLLSGLRITDPTSGLQVLNRRALAICVSDAYSVEYPDADMLMAYSRAGLRVMETPAAFRPRVTGTSMHSSFKGVYYVYKVTLSMLMIASRP